MTLKITFELSEKDLKHFRGVMRKARDAAGETNEDKVIGAANKLLDEVRAAKVPEFISERLEKLENMIAMVQDQGWAIPDQERARVVSALTYFADPQDLIPDDIPGLGFLDDAIMIELVVRELRHEIEAYDDFCTFRKAECARRKVSLEDANLGRVDFLDNRRKQLHSRMRRRRGRDRGGRGGGGSRGSSFTLW